MLSEDSGKVWHLGAGEGTNGSQRKKNYLLSAGERRKTLTTSQNQRLCVEIFIAMCDNTATTQVTQ